MQHRWMLRAATAGALGFSLCVFANVVSAHVVSHAPADASQKPSAPKVPLRDKHMPAAQPSMPMQSALNAPWQKIAIARGDTLSGALARAGLGSGTWKSLLALAHTKPLRHLHPGDTIAVQKTPTGRLARLRFKLNARQTLAIGRRNGHLVSAVQDLPTGKREITASGTINGSLSHALAKQDVPAGVAAQLARIYHHRHDLNHLQQGDHFAVVYQATYVDGHEIGVGPVVASSITSHHRIYRAFRAKGENGRPAYFDGAGRSYKPAFTRKPVAYTRISSPFNLHRMNPVTHRIEPHYGVDMAAPIGTPIHAAANGTVKFAGWARGYGRLVELKNMDHYSTRYAHMHRFAKGLHAGEHVTKGEVIGYVGESGEATGPHLHFEIRHYGKPHNPLTIKLPGGRDLPKDRLAAYRRKIRPLIAKLSPAPTTLLAKTSAAPAHGPACLGPNGFRHSLPTHGASNGILCLTHDTALQT